MAATRSAPTASPLGPWRSLTELGRLQGLSAVQFGRLLIQAGLREANGQPSARAIAQRVAHGLHADQPNRQTFWHQERCLRLLKEQGLLHQRTSPLVEQWSELLAALFIGSPSISTSAEQMAEELPLELVGDVNHQLKAKGCPFQVKPQASQLRSGGGPRLACSPSPAGPANGLRRYG
ncbi:hypothetical protein [Cyanobium sp. Morenito 9A2]|uniref:hypothetical protein n=1 Tax=Cyanobium sp. Morenito 9A2 TaxID=2823718 RepID=UPI0020CC7519|nr:hypothetical protein [Cyanobium sp. Morenito 9A2]MCP9850408.1 hypothetical protein [Cyanobium sp. Morenito 9A2]